jgi:hypothetical protein
MPYPLVHPPVHLNIPIVIEFAAHVWIAIISIISRRLASAKIQQAQQV